MRDTAVDDVRQHDFCFAVAWRVLDLLRTLIPAGDEQREAMAEVYEIARQELGHYERGRQITRKEGGL